MPSDLMPLRESQLSIEEDGVAVFTHQRPAARNGMSFVKIGLIPNLGAFHFLPRAVGLPMAKELALTARRVDATEGRQLGFVHALHEPEALLPEAMRFARRFTAGPRKALMNRSFETSYATLAELECNAQAVPPPRPTTTPPSRASCAASRPPTTGTAARVEPTPHPEWGRSAPRRIP